MSDPAPLRRRKEIVDNPVPLGRNRVVRLPRTADPNLRPGRRVNPPPIPPGGPQIPDPTPDEVPQEPPVVPILPPDACHHQWMVIAEQRWRWRVRVQCWHCGDWHSVAGAWWSKRDVDRIVVRTLKLLEYRNG